MAYTRDYSRNEMSRSELGAGYKTASSHFYTPSRQVGATYGRGSSSGPGVSTSTQTSRFSLGGSNLRKQTEGSELRQSLGVKPVTQSASKYGKYDYTNRRNIDFGLGHLADSGKTSAYSKTHYRTSGAHDSIQNSTFEKHSMSFGGRIYGTTSYGSYSRQPRESEKKNPSSFTQTEKGSIGKSYDNMSILKSSFVSKESSNKLKDSQAVNFEESSLSVIIRFQGIHKEN